MWIHFDNEDVENIIEILHKTKTSYGHKIANVFREVLENEIKRKEIYNKYRNAIGPDDGNWVDSDAPVDITDDGALVMAWYYVPNEEAGISTPEFKDEKPLWDTQEELD